MKIEAKQINDWAQKAYKNAINHGWHDTPKSRAHYVMMIVTELVEAVQADRNRRHMDDLDNEGLKTVLANDHGGGLFENYYQNTIENKVESEFADICIRVFDFMGVENLAGEDIDTEGITFAEESFTEVAYEVTGYIVGVYKPEVSLQKSCNELLARVFAWAEKLNIDLPQHINLKMRYNESRSWMHGNKLY